FIQPEPGKYVKVTLRENDNGFYISAMQTTDTPENAQPGVTLQASATTVPVTEAVEETSEAETEESDKEDEESSTEAEE
ncbi:MAG: hypothetical protein IIW48_00935, partial [Clostridia bacterium]|nr:hypothetical protein [Clostridia bacterium]